MRYSKTFHIRPEKTLSHVTIDISLVTEDELNQIVELAEPFSKKVEEIIISFLSKKDVY